MGGVSVRDGELQETGNFYIQRRRKRAPRPGGPPAGGWRQAMDHYKTNGFFFQKNPSLASSKNSTDTKSDKRSMA